MKTTKMVMAVLTGALTLGIVSTSEPVSAQQYKSSKKAVSKTNKKAARKTRKKSSPKTAARRARIERAIQVVDDGAAGKWQVSVDRNCRLQQTISTTSSNNVIDLTRVRMIQFNSDHLGLVCDTGNCASYSHELGSSSSNKLNVNYQEASKGKVLRALQEAVSECRKYHGLRPLPTGGRA